MHRQVKLGASVAATILGVLPQLAQAQSTCPDSGYAIGYFNGLGGGGEDKTLLAATLGRHAVESLIGPSYKNQQIIYKTFYNHTKGFSSDVREVIVQRALEYDRSGTLGRRTRIINDLMLGDESSLNELIAYAQDDVSANLIKFRNDVRTIIENDIKNNKLYIQQISAMLLAEYEYNNGVIREWARQGRKVLLIGYSQGSLFSNQSYKYLLPIVGSKSVTVFNIGPASSENFGDYLLSKNDVVINLLRTGAKTLEPNVDIVGGAAFGHSLTGAYLDPARSGRAEAITRIKKTLDTLEAPPCETSYHFKSSLLSKGFGTNGRRAGFIEGDFSFKIRPNFTGTLNQNDITGFSIYTSGAREETLRSIDKPWCKLTACGEVSVASFNFVDGKITSYNFLFNYEYVNDYIVVPASTNLIRLSYSGSNVARNKSGVVYYDSFEALYRDARPPYLIVAFNYSLSGASDAPGAFTK